MPVEGCYIAAVGVSHRDTPIALRERLSALPADLPRVLGRVLAVEGVAEAAFLSTCNRAELYLAAPALSVGEGGLEGETGTQSGTGGAGRKLPGDLLQRAAAALCEAVGVDPEEVKPSLYELRGLEAVRHLFEVACGLDSMVPGENEILSQVKTAYQAAADARAAGSTLSRLFQRTLKVAKDVRSRTGISKRRLSVATVVTDLAKKVFGRLEGTRVALVGAGEMAELTLKALVSEKAEVAVVANRSMESARRLVGQYGGEAIGLDEVRRRMTDTDVLVASTSAPHVIVKVEHVREAVRPRKGRPVLLVDLGVPRNVDPDVGALSGVILYNLDDLEGVVATNKAYRLEEAEKARTLIEEELEKYAGLLRTEDAAGTITELCETMRRIGEAELSRAVSRLGDVTPEQREELERMAQRIVGKVLHAPISAIKQEARSGDGAEMQRAARRLFGLEAPLRRPEAREQSEGVALDGGRRKNEK